MFRPTRRKSMNSHQETRSYRIYRPSNVTMHLTKIKITIPILTFLLSTTPTQSNIGDNMRSNESSTSFFQSVDTDGDGILRAAEVANFLEHEIGDASSFVTSYEISSEANRVIRALDQNEDETVEQKDIMEYWDHMENLLTAEEVEEWVVHAVQLPDYVGRIFKENAVTGYDFPELVENNGEIITTELGVTKPSFVKKIVNLMHARMLGIGSMPEVPSDINYKVEDNCHSVTFNWKKSHASGFPVHSYRVQKRAIMTKASSTQHKKRQKELSTINTSKSNSDSNICNYSDGKFMASFRYDDTCHGPEPSNNNIYIQEQQSHLNWVTVHQGAEAEFFDHSLESGYSFKYRIQAWNSVGRSAWETIDISDQLKKLKCLKNPSSLANQMRSLNIPNLEDSSIPFRRIYFFSGLIITIARGVVAIIAFIAAFMKWKRASSDSTMLVATMKAPFPRLLQWINKSSKNVIGIEIVPSYIIGNEDAVVPAHDVYVKAVGLNGFKKDGVVFAENDTPFDRRLKFSRSESQRNNSCRSLIFQKNNSCRSLLSSDDSYSVPLCVETAANGGKDMKSRDKSSKLNLELFDKKSQCGVSPSSPPTPVTKNDTNRSFATSRTKSSNDEELLDDYTICNTCRKKYKLGKRYRHHCARCLSTFCHKHGRTTHSNFTSCKIPGSCVCNKCLQMDMENES